MSLLCTVLLLQVGGAWEELRAQTSGAAYEDLYGWSLANAGDLDGDSVDDLLVGCTWYGPGSIGAGALFVHSGATGIVLRRHDGTSPDWRFYGSDVAGGADLDGDAVPDYLVGNQAYSPASLFVEVFSGASGALLYQLLPSLQAKNFGGTVAMIDDLDADGVVDLAVTGRSTSPSIEYLFLYSGSSGAEIAKHALPFSPQEVVGLDDLDGDQIPEIAISRPYENIGMFHEAGTVRILSGATGVEIRRWEGSAYHEFLGYSLCAVPDRDGDGKRDLLIGVPTYLEVGHVLLVSTSTGATIQRFDRIGGDALEQFGQCVGVAGDMDGDGVEDYLMGGGHMTIAGSQGSGRGGLQIVSGASSEILHEIEGAFDDSHLGHACVGLGDLDHDGLAEAAVAATTVTLDDLFVWGTGMVQLVGFERFLNSSSNDLPAAAGSSVALDFDFPASAAGWEYRFLVSATGDGPTLAGVLIPLTPDALVARTWSGNYPSSMHAASLAGILDGTGHATGSFSFAPGLLGSMVGRTIYTAAVALPLGASRPQISSASVRFTVAP